MTTQNQKHTEVSSKDASRLRRRRQLLRRKRRARRLFWGTLLLLLLLLPLDYLIRDARRSAAPSFTASFSGGFAADGLFPADDPLLRELSELYDKNEEARDFVEGYPDRDRYLQQEIDLAGEISPGEVPLLMQWDKRWGYAPYGDSIVGLAGCGPTCLSMAYIYLTGDCRMHPGAMAEYADKEGYCSAAGTDWSLWTMGAEGVGLTGEELPLSEASIRSVLDGGGVVVCSMRPGDFTTTGHFILIRGYDGNGFYVNDPNRKSNSTKQWSYDDLYGQIKNLWSLTL